VNRVTDVCLDAHFVLPRALSSPRFRRIERLGKLYVHHLRFTKPAEMDGQVQEWLRHSYSEYGQRRWLEGPKASKPRARH
jgi:hypothetical protein